MRKFFPIPSGDNRSPCQKIFFAILDESDKSTLGNSFYVAPADRGSIRCRFRAPQHQRWPASRLWRAETSSIAPTAPTTMLGISFLSCEMTFIARDRKRDRHDRNPASTDNFSGKQSDLAYPTGGNGTDLFDPSPAPRVYSLAQLLFAFSQEAP